MVDIRVFTGASSRSCIFFFGGIRGFRIGEFGLGESYLVLFGSVRVVFGRMRFFGNIG